MDIFLSVNPYFINIKGTGMAIVATPPRIDIAGPTPRAWNMGLAARGSPAAKILRRKVFAEVALAAYTPYVSTRKLMHCWKMTLNPAPIKSVARIGTIQWILGSAVQPNQNNPIANMMAPNAYRSKLVLA